MKTMSFTRLSLAFVVLLVGIAFGEDVRAKEEKKPMRIFLLSAKPSAKGWQIMKANPSDRRKDTERAMEEIGCKMLGYYFGLTDGRNYILAAVPDGKTVQALLIQRLASDLVEDYTAIELVESSDMPAVFKRLTEIDRAGDTVPTKDK